MTHAIVISVAILAFLMSFSIGANDAANALATSYGSNAMRLLYLVLLGSLFEFIGAFFCSTKVAGRLVHGIINQLGELPDHTVEQMMLGTSIASFLFIMSSSLFGVPISGTHTVVGAIIGAGIIAIGFESINWNKMSTIVASWFISPLLAASIAFALILFVCHFTLNKTKRSLNARLLWVTLICGVATSTMTYMLLALLGGDENIDQYMYLIPVAFIAGVVFSRVLLQASIPNRNNARKVGCCDFLSNTLSFWSCRFAVKELRQQAEDSNPLQLTQTDDEAKDVGVISSIRKESFQPSIQSNASQNSQNGDASSDYTDTTKPPELQALLPKKKSQNYSCRQKSDSAGEGPPESEVDFGDLDSELIQELYRYFMICAAMMVCLAHGSNDVANSISPLLVVLELNERKAGGAYLIGSAGIALGLLLLGYRVMETVGKKVIKLDYAKGFSAQLSTAIAVILGSILGMPLSTTHCMVGALLGLVLGGKLDTVKQVYTVRQPEAPLSEALEAERDPNEHVQGDENSLNKKTLVKILGWWLATVPVALGASAAITVMLI